MTENPRSGSYADIHSNYECHGFQKKTQGMKKVYRKPYQNTEIEDEVEEAE